MRPFSLNMKLKEFLQTILFYISVPKCACCGERLLREEKAICISCKIKYDDILKRDCSICAKPFHECDCSFSYLKTHYVRKVVKCFRYQSDVSLPSNMLIYNLKREYRSDVVDFLSEELFKSFKNKNYNLENCLITNVPRRRSSIKKYGYDHSKILAKSLAKKLNLQYEELLISRAKKNQKENKTREQRLKNAEFEYKNLNNNINGKTVILLDDIITTGASMGACAMLLKGLGAKKIIGAAISIVYKDDYISFDNKKRNS